MATPRFALTEAAIALLRHTDKRLDRRSSTEIARSRISSGALTTVATDPVQVLQQASFLRVLGITESYIDAMFVSRLAENVDMSVARLSRMVEAVEFSSASSWPVRNAAFKLHHNLPLSSCAEWKAVQAAAQVRNCLAHGLGRLTAKQRKSTDLAREIAFMDISVGGGQMHLAPTTLSIVASRCIKFVTDVDAKL